MNYTATFLLGLLEGIPIPPEIEAGECRDVEIPVKDGWKVNVYYDCGGLDFINHFVTPDGEVVNFWNWQDSEDKRVLAAW